MKGIFGILGAIVALLVLSTGLYADNSVTVTGSYVDYSIDYDVGDVVSIEEVVIEESFDLYSYFALKAIEDVKIETLSSEIYNLNQKIDALNHGYRKVEVVILGKSLNGSIYSSNFDNISKR